jgi:hypothetical protein
MVSRFFFALSEGKLNRNQQSVGRIDRCWKTGKSCVLLKQPLGLRLFQQSTYNYGQALRRLYVEKYVVALRQTDDTNLYM